MWCSFAKRYGKKGRDSSSNNVETQHEILIVPTAPSFVFCVTSKYSILHVAGSRWLVFCWFSIKE